MRHKVQIPNDLKILAKVCIILITFKGRGLSGDWLNHEKTFRMVCNREN